MFKMFEDSSPPSNQSSTHPERAVEKAGLYEEEERSLNLRPAGWSLQVRHDTATMIPVVQQCVGLVQLWSTKRDDVTYQAQ